MVDEIQKAQGLYVAVLDLVNMFTYNINLFLVSRAPSISLIWLPMDFLKSPVIAHNLCRQDLNLLKLTHCYI